VVSGQNHVVSAPLSRSLDLKILDLDQERERSRARDLEASNPAPTKYPPAWKRRALSVPAWLDAELRRSLNGRANLLDGIYRKLDDRLVETGETYDSRWIREHVLALAPPIERLERSKPAAGTLPRYDLADDLRAECDRVHGGSCHNLHWHVSQMQIDARKSAPAVIECRS
jgi:hypothetical protein